MSNELSRGRLQQMIDTPTTELRKLDEPTLREMARMALSHLADGQCREDAERLDWATDNPVKAINEIQARIAICGRGGWEIKFNFRGAIDAALQAAVDRTTSPRH